MTRLTKDQIIQHRTQLERSEDPEKMLHNCEELMDCMGSADLFTHPGVDFIPEGWAAAKFAQRRSADNVRLIPQRDQWPDFELLFGGQKESWEFTEADIPDRRRGDEYQAGRSLATQDPVEDWIKRAEQAPEAIRQRCTNKVAKHYSGRAGLLVYLNIGEFGISQAEIEASFKDATRSAKDAFSEVWVLWKERAYPIWKDGRPVFSARCVTKNVPG